MEEIRPHTAARVGPYVVERVLGEGGMGVVHLARSRDGRQVAVQVARAELARDPGFRERFRVEAESARRVGGFRTAPVVDADANADAPWLATAHVPGPTLAELLAVQGPLDEARLRDLGAALAEALRDIHACGLVHRDLKPGNVVMAADGPRVLGVGIARAVENSRLTMTGAGLGTPGFLAPEQVEGLDVTGAADVFALGAVLVAAAGGTAFGDGTAMALMYRSVHQDADVSAVPVSLRPVVGSCLAREPRQRPAPETLREAFAAGPPPAPTPAPPSAPPPGYAPVAVPPPPPYTPPAPGGLPPGPAPRAGVPPLRAVVRNNAGRGGARG
ncbi:serine/threonine-protein kinase, partial [Streptomyces sp. NPDC048106]|uniref:serine/threonine-protein kinase n=1 Tax=Streptomyces sp. NPDC048106 TaxID=3155750 RepID=UPI0034517C72